MKDPTSAYLQGSAIGAIIGLLAGIAIGLCIPRTHTPDTAITPTPDTTHITITDTIRIIHPVPRDTIIQRYDTARLPIINPDTTTTTPDTANVAIPITRIEYRDTLYRAVIEGYNPRLLSLDITAPKEITTITHTIPTPHRRWHIGPSIGLGYDGTHLRPFIGATLTLSLISF